MIHLSHYTNLMSSAIILHKWFNQKLMISLFITLAFLVTVALKKSWEAAWSFNHSAWSFSLISPSPSQANISAVDGPFHSCVSVNVFPMQQLQCQTTLGVFLQMKYCENAWTTSAFTLQTLKISQLWSCNIFTFWVRLGRHKCKFHSISMLGQDFKAQGTPLTCWVLHWFQLFALCVRSRHN